MSEEKAIGSAEGAKSLEEGDEELNELLNSALEDFSKTGDKTTKAVSKKTDDNDKKDEVPSSELVDADNWSEDFIRQAASQFETNMASLLNGIPGINEGQGLSQEQVQQSLQRMAEAAAQVVSNPVPTEQSNEFSRTITQTLQDLSQAQTGPFNEQELMNMFSGLGVGEGQQEQGNAFLPLMQGMMQSLLSKDVLYPSLKDIVDRFPKWIEDNKDNVDASDMDRYKKQQQLMIDVCTELEKETESDSNGVKQERFEKVLNMMQKLQDYGQPPTDLVGDTGPGVQFDSQGNPVLPEGLLPADPSQCSVM